MTNIELAAAFEELAARLSLTDLQPYRYMAYRTAAEVFRELPESAAVLHAEGRITDLHGIGPAIGTKVGELLETGTFDALERAREDVPDGLLELVAVPGVGKATARRIWAELDVATFDGVVVAAHSGELGQLRGVGPGLVAAVIETGQERVVAGGDGPVLPVPPGAPGPGTWFLRDQVPTVLDALGCIGSADGPPVPAGAWERGHELVRGAVAVLASTRGAEAVAADLRARGWTVDVAAAVAADGTGDGGEVLPAFAGEPSGAELAAALAEAGTGRDATACAVGIVQGEAANGMPVRVIVTEPEVHAAARDAAASPAGWLARTGEEPGELPVPPELREQVLAGDLAAADIPADLVGFDDLIGDLHSHSTWSDGKASILDMARASRARGDRYLAVTDHSAPYTMVGGLDGNRLAEQGQEIHTANVVLAQEARDEGAGDFTVLQGSEVEVLADGKLGLPDDVLAGLDWVVASIHVSQRQTAKEVTARMERVLANPYVDCIGHPTSRLLLRRPRTNLDIDRLIELAADLGVVLEINASPRRLDLGADHARQALEAGVRLAINTDSHRPTTLGMRHHGISVARRAAAPRAKVVNCLPWAELDASRRRHASG